MFVKITVEEALNMENKIFVDLRSPMEFSNGSIPKAINISILNDYERADVGTIYKNKSIEEAKSKGIEYASSKLSYIYNIISSLTKEYKNIILFCWRGGLRSSSVYNFLNTLGVNVYLLEGGYKQYRKYVTDYFNTGLFTGKFIVLHGYTGVGKTEILTQLKGFNIPILNLEDIAQNSGSVFGKIAYQNKENITQKNFEALLFENLRLNKNKYIVVESEGSRLGGLMLPKELWNKIATGKHILISTNIENRIERLVNDYVVKISNCDILLEDAIVHLKNKIGKEKIAQFISWIEEQEYSKVAEKLITEYYDPLYKNSIDNYKYITEIKYDNINQAIDQIVEIYFELENKMI